MVIMMHEEIAFIYFFQCELYSYEFSDLGIEVNFLMLNTLSPLLSTNYTNAECRLEVVFGFNE